MNDGERSSDLASLTVPLAGAVKETGDPFEPCWLLDPAGVRVVPVAEFLANLQACGRSEATQRSYSLSLLRWFRFLWAVEVPWDQATRTEARDYIRWVQVAGKPERRHWRRGGDAPAVRPGIPVPNQVTGKSPRGPQYAATTVAHAETVARTFYDFHLQAGTGPLVNPFPLARSGRAHAHHNPVEPYDGQRSGLFRPRAARRIPRQVPDGRFDELFAALRSHRDRALLAFWISSGVRASELLGVLAGGADPGQQLITVIRKGSRAVQQVPASPDAFVWLRLYQQQMHGLVAARPADPLWWTLRRPFRPLSYPAARVMFTRANQVLGSNWTLHDLRHSASYRMARDPQVQLTDVQWVLGHAHLSTTELYLNTTPQDAITDVLAHYQRRAEARQASPEAPGTGRLRYRPEILDALFGDLR
jgi:site-specific recombinase XerC